MTVRSWLKQLACASALLLLPAVAHGQQGYSAVPTSPPSEASQGYITLQNDWQNGYLNTAGGAVSQNADVKTPGTHWIMVPAGSKNPSAFRLKSQDGKFLHLDHDTLEVSASKPNWEAGSDQWMFESAGNANMRLKNVEKPTAYLNNEKGKVAAGQIQPGWQSALWTLQVTLTIDNTSNAPLDVFVDDDSGAPQLMASLPTKNRLIQLTPLGATWRIGQNDQWVGQITSTSNPNQRLRFAGKAPAAGAAQYQAVPIQRYQAVPIQKPGSPNPGASQYQTVPRH